MGFDSKKKVSRSNAKKKVAIIGGGVSGMSSVALLKEEGHEPTCFEMTNDFGGTWVYRETPVEGVGSIMPNTIINHSKEMGALSDFPPRKEYNNYMRHQEVHQYFMEYWTQRDCLKHGKTNMEVIEVKRTNDYEETGRWSVSARHTVTKEVFSSVYDCVLVCVGHINRPKMPTFPGQEKFMGKIMHSHSLKDVTAFKGQNVVVVGTACSGLDAAVEISNFAKQVYLSTKSGAYIMTRVGPKGMPMDATLLTRLNGRCAQVLPRKLFSAILNKFYLNERFDHKNFKVRPKYQYLQRSPIINDEIFLKILSGSVNQKTDIDHFTEDGVVFKGEDSVTAVDSVIMATGYTWKFPFLEEGIVICEDRKFHLYKYVFPPHLKHPTLALIGFMYPLGPGFPLGELQARWTTQIFTGNLKLPSREKMVRDIDRKYETCLQRYAPDAKIMLRADYTEYMDEMAKELGVMPNLWKAFFTDQRLYWKLMFGPYVSYQFRLQGPHKWEGARRAIMTSKKRILYPLRGKHSDEEDID